MHARLALLYCKRHFFQERSLSCFRRRYDHTPLPFSDRGYQVHDPHRCAASCCLKADPLIREDRGEIFKVLPFHRLGRTETIDGRYVEERAELFSLGLDPGITHDDVTGLQPESADLGRRDIDIIFPGKIVLAADEPKAVLHHFQDTVGGMSAVQLLDIRLLFLFLHLFFYFFFRLIACLFLFFLLVKREHRVDQVPFLHSGDPFHLSRLCKVFQCGKGQRFILFSCHKCILSFSLIA